MNLIPYLPVLVSIITVVGGAFIYRWQKNEDRKATLIAERRELYRTYISQVQVLRLYAIKGRRQDFKEFYPDYKRTVGEVFVTVPKNVVTAIVELEKEITLIEPLMGDPTSQKFLTACEDLSQKYFGVIAAMRVDSFGEDGITTDTFSTFTDELTEMRTLGKKK